MLKFYLCLLLLLAPAWRGQGSTLDLSLQGGLASQGANFDYWLYDNLTLGGGFEQRWLLIWPWDQNRIFNLHGGARYYFNLFERTFFLRAGLALEFRNFHMENAYGLVLAGSRQRFLSAFLGFGQDFHLKNLADGSSIYWGIEFFNTWWPLKSWHHTILEGEYRLKEEEKMQILDLPESISAFSLRLGYHFSSLDGLMNSIF